MEHKWFPERFSEINKNKFILKKAYQVVEEEAPLIQLYYTTPFYNPIYLQLVLQATNARITKSISKEAQGRHQISIQSGYISDQEVNKLKKAIESLSINGLGLDDEFPEGRDGYYAEITISKHLHSSTLSWFETSTPTGWDILFGLVEMLLEIDKSVIYETQNDLHADVSLEEKTSSLLNLGGKSMILEFKEVKKE